MDSDRIRNALGAFTADLRSRKLVVIMGLLVVVAIAVPLLLSHSGTATSLAALPATPTVTTPAPTAAGLSTTRHQASPKRILTGPAHNPFVSSTPKPASKRTASEAVSAKTPSAKTLPDSGAATVTTAGGSAPQTTSTGSARSNAIRTTGSQKSDPVNSTRAAATQHTTAGATAAQTVTVIKTVTKIPPFADYEARVSLREDGTTQKPKVLDRVARFQLLPADNGAFASFLGVRDDKKTAVFVLASGVAVTGQGRCAPTSSRCVFLTLEPGGSVRLRTPDWAGSKTFTLRYSGVRLVTSSASVVDVDENGRAVVKKAAATFSSLKTMTYDQYTGLLSIALRTTAASVAQPNSN